METNKILISKTFGSCAEIIYTGVMHLVRTHEMNDPITTIKNSSKTACNTQSIATGDYKAYLIKYYLG